MQSGAVLNIDPGNPRKMSFTNDNIAKEKGVSLAESLSKRFFFIENEFNFASRKFSMALEFP
jgi:hypothetical protein